MLSKPIVIKIIIVDKRILYESRWERLTAQLLASKLDGETSANVFDILYVLL